MPSGMTPMIVAGLPSMRSVLPMIVAVVAVAVLPHAVAEDHHALGPRRVVAGREVAAEERLLAEQAEDVGREALARAPTAGRRGRR